MRGNWRYVICPVIMILGILATINLWQIFTAYSRIYGTPRFEREIVNSVMEWDSPMLFLMPSGNMSVMIEDRLPHLEFDGTAREYEILVNGYMTRTQELGAGFIQSVFDITFHDLNGDVASRVVLTIRFEFMSTQTRLIVSTTNTNVELGYFRQWEENHGINISIVYRQTVV